MNAKTRRVMDALGVVPAPESDVTPGPTPTPSFDGGARRNQPAPAESHGEWLARVVIRGEPDVPADWFRPGG